MKNKKLNFKKENLVKLNKEDLKKLAGGNIFPAPTDSKCTTNDCIEQKYRC
ncbi:MAG: TIGR04149 family rSAM-modified RiPP [Tannerellaceae bacterium]|nr:TIGR04149 family rSAM-modified RiPP [Tannerellaceae bacterium]